MKKMYFPIFIGLLIFTSCKKDYTCDCTVTESDTKDGSVTNTYTMTTTMKDASKKAIQNNGFCISSEDVHVDNHAYLGYDPNTFESIYGTVTYTTKTDCKLSK